MAKPVGTGTFSNLGHTQAFEAVNVIRRRCANFHLGPGPQGSSLKCANCPVISWYWLLPSARSRLGEAVTQSTAKQIPTPEELGFDPGALRERYAADAYVKSFARDALHEELDAVVIGGGFGGMLAAVRLQEAGITNIRIIEKAGDFGGTWYWNRYPGAQCDVEGYLYLPLLEETGYIPKERYSFAPEIFAHAQRIGKHFHLYDKACFQTKVKEARWDDAAGRWTITTDRGDVFNARFVLMSSGPLNKPKLPGIPGIEKFKGHTFHTSRWDYDYTGGNTTGGLHKLGDKRVGIIGTGATAIQCIPHLGAHARQLYVLQRTPSSVDERNNTPTDPEWAKKLKPGWQEYRNRNFTALLDGVELEKDEVRDKWTSPLKKLGELISSRNDSNLSADDKAALAEIADFQKMNDIRGRVSKTVQDPATADSLKPWYGQWCKRPTFNDEYLATFNRPNVKLLDTGGKGVDRVTEHGVVIDGVEYEVDCLIFATGFEVGTAYTRRAEFAIYGRGGISLAEYWANGMQTFHGFLTHGFPNCFHMGLTQTGLTANFTYMLNKQAHHVAQLITEVNRRKAKSIEPTPEAQAVWVQIVNGANPMTKYQSVCTPGYYNGEGGLGLALTKRFLDANHARITVQSEKGAGAAFTIYFSTQIEPGNGKIGDPVRAQQGRPKLLLVEDDSDTQAMMLSMLHNVFDLRIAASGDAVRNIVAQGPMIDAVLMDISLSGHEDGLQITRFLRSQQRFRAIPIIAVTAHASVEHRRLALEAGCDVVLTKPVRRSEILAAVNPANREICQ